MKILPFRLSLSDKEIQVFIGQFLRYGALTSCLIAMTGGILYLSRYGMQLVPDYGTFSGESSSLTTFSGIWKGLLAGNPVEIIQFGIVVLIATPVLRVVLSLFSFMVERDKLYVCITLIVLCIILFSMFSGMKI